MRTYWTYTPIVGTSGDDDVIADFAAADAIYSYEIVWGGILGNFELIETWDRTVDAGAGDDIVIRDRPGDYKADPGVYHEVPGNVLVTGGEGEDTISYALYEGGVRIDLVVDNGLGLGLAQAIGTTPDPIFGTDELDGFEHAVGALGNDSINGSAIANCLWGLSGADTIRGGGGNDRLWGDADNDRLFGDAGADTVYGGAGRDDLRGGTEGDRLEGGGGNDTVYGEDGNDLIYGGDGNDLVWGGNGHDVIWGGAGVDQLGGQDGNDALTLQGNGGSAYGHAGNDVVTGSTGNDQLHGQDGNDILQGNAGADTLNGGAGADTINGGTGTDTAVWEGAAAVVVTLNDLGNGTAVQAGVTDQLLALERIVTGWGNDSVTTGSAANRIETGLGADTVNAGSGNDTVLGGDGNDRLDGGWGNDSLVGGNGHDRVLGGQNLDRLDGGSGNDTLLGGNGADTLTGGSGADAFIWTGGDAGGWDIVTDFVIGSDRIGFTSFLADPPQAGESWVGKVVAFFAENGESTSLSAQTAGGAWQVFAILRGFEDPNVVAAAIADGSLFSGVVPEGPGGLLG
jgi:Ca2+-binding RTX toxin-like protein